jgi:alkylation response protein AidB-like acyl-CoA dehydrogenase
LGGLPVGEFGSTQQQQRYLPALASGKAKFSAAIAELAMNPAIATKVSATHGPQGWTLNGKKSVVPDGAVADFILVPAEDAAGQQTVFIVDIGAPGVILHSVEFGLAGERAAHLTLDNVTVDDDTVLGEPGQGADIMEWLEQRANVCHCALQVGVTEEAMKRTAAFLGERKQFGVALGTFQALAGSDSLYVLAGAVASQ